MENRIRTAIEFLKDGLPFRVENLGLALNKSGDLEVSGWSGFVEFKNLNKSNCLKELSEMKSEFREMLNISEELGEFNKGRGIDYLLNYDESGKASITICSETNGIIKWYVELK